jgi:hypothetical protein
MKTGVTWNLACLFEVIFRVVVSFGVSGIFVRVRGSIPCPTNSDRVRQVFYNRDFRCTLSFRHNTTTLYLMISCEGELRNGTKYAKLAYLLLISGNSGVQQRMAFGEEKLVAPLIAIPYVDKVN